MARPTKLTDKVFSFISKETFKLHFNDFGKTLALLNRAKNNLSLDDIIKKAMLENFAEKTQFYKM